MSGQENRRFKGFLSPSRALNSLVQTRFHIRKRRKESNLRDRRFGKSKLLERPDANPSEVDAVAMSDDVALKTIQEFCLMDPRHSNYHHLLMKSIQAMKVFTSALKKDDNQQYVHDCLQHGLLNQFFGIMELWDKISGCGVPVPDETRHLQMAAACCLTDIAYSRHPKELFDHPNCLRIFWRVIDNLPFPEVRCQFMWCLGNMVGADDTSSYRRMILRDQALVCAIIKNSLVLDDSGLVEKAVWLLGNLMMGDPAPGWDLIRVPLDQCLVTLVDLVKLPQSTETDKLLIEFFCAVRKSIKNDHQVVEQIGLRFIPLAFDVAVRNFDEEHLRLHALVWDCLAIISTGTKKLGNALVNQNLFGLASKLLEHHDRLMKIEKGDILLEKVCLAMKNLFACPSSFIMFVRTKKLLPTVITLASTTKWLVRHAALHVLCHFLCGAGFDDALTYLQSDPGLRVLFDYLRNTTSKDIILTLRLLDAVYHVVGLDIENDNRLMVGETLFENTSLSLMEKLQYDKNMEISRKAAKIIDEFYYDEETAYGDPQTENASFGSNIKTPQDLSPSPQV